MTKLGRWCIACLALVFTSALADQDDIAALCSTEKRMRLMVKKLPEHASSAGLTQERLADTVGARLRKAHILDPSSGSALYVTVSVGKPEHEGAIFPFYVISLQYQQALRHPGFGTEIRAVTWFSRGFGEGTAAFVLDHLNQHLATFIDLYLRASSTAQCRALRMQKREA